MPSCAELSWPACLARTAFSESSFFGLPVSGAWLFIPPGLAFTPGFSCMSALSLRFYAYSLLAQYPAPGFLNHRFCALCPVAVSRIQPLRVHCFASTPSCRVPYAWFPVPVCLCQAPLCQPLWCRYACDSARTGMCHLGVIVTGTRCRTPCIEFVGLRRFATRHAPPRCHNIGRLAHRTRHLGDTNANVPAHRIRHLGVINESFGEERSMQNPSAR